MKTLLLVIFIGIGASLVMDVWMLLRRKIFGVALPNYALVGRWLAYMPRGVFRHESIVKAPSVRYEALLGWVTHYLTGIAFAGLLFSLAGIEWIRQPTPGVALLVGIVTVLAPFLLMQPGMGAGIAASRTPNPRSARIQSLLTHMVFGLGLYLTAMLLSMGN